MAGDALFEALLDKILEAAPEVRMVGVFKDITSPVYVKARPGIEHKLIEEDQDSLRLMFLTISNALARIEDELGSLVFSGAFFEKLHFYFFNYNDHTVAISCDLGPIEDIAKRIGSVLKKFEN